MTQWAERLQPQQEKLQQWLDTMSTRERYMVLATAVFVLLSAVGSALFYMHKAADVQQHRLMQLKDTVVWMQTHVAEMQPDQGAELSVADKVQRAAQQSNLALTLQQDGEELRIQAQHEQYVVVANFLMSLAQMGLTIEMLELNQDVGQIKLAATLH